MTQCRQAMEGLAQGEERFRDLLDEAAIAYVYESVDSPDRPGEPLGLGIGWRCPYLSPPAYKAAVLRESPIVVLHGSATLADLGSASSSTVRAKTTSEGVIRPAGAPSESMIKTKRWR